MRLQTSKHSTSNARYFFLITARHHFTLRLGVENQPLFSERNPGVMPPAERWKYLMGRRISWRALRLYARGRNA